VDSPKPTNQRTIRLAVRELCARFDDDYWMRHDHDHEFPWEFYAEMAKGGWIGIAIPEAYGGAGRHQPRPPSCSRRWPPPAPAMNGASAVHLSIFGMHPVVLHGSEELKQRVLPGVAAGTTHVAFGSPNPTLAWTPPRSAPARYRGRRLRVRGRKCGRPRRWSPTGYCAHPHHPA